jgi:hypothetical protein
MAPSALPQCIVSGMEFVAQICENLLLKTAEAEAVRKIFVKIFAFFAPIFVVKNFALLYIWLRIRR